MEAKPLMMAKKSWWKPARTECMAKAFEAMYIREWVSAMVKGARDGE